MGGNVFKGTRRATPEDKKIIEQALVSGPLGTIDELKWIGSSFHQSSSYGDLDLALKLPKYYGEDDVLGWIKIGLRDADLDFEYKKIGKSHFFRVGDVQLDVSLVSEDVFNSWVVPATTVSIFDPYKALYRNELLYAAVKYIFSTNILAMTGSQVKVFSRVRYTLDQGLVKSTYTYLSPKTGKFLVSPIKVEDQVQFTNFMTLTEALRLPDKSTDFLDVLKALDRRFSPETNYEILSEVIDGLFKKNVAVPPIIYQHLERYKESCEQSNHYIWTHEPDTPGSLGDDQVCEEEG